MAPHAETVREAATRSQSAKVMWPDAAGRDPSIDVLRGIAILLVVVYHAVAPEFNWWIPWIGNYRDFSPGFLSLLPTHLLSLAWCGVPLFFVLSGYCIHASFLKNAQFSTRAFLWRRFWRIYPAYIIALSFFVAAAHVSGSSPDWRQVVSHVFLIHNADKSLIFGINPSFWSIAVEVQLYLLYPLALFLRERCGMRVLLGTALALSLFVKVAYLLRQAGLPQHAIGPAYVWPPATWFDWLLGAYVAECHMKKHGAFQRRGVWWLASATALFACTLWRPGMAFAFSLSAVLSALVLETFLLRPPSPSLLVRGIAFVGVISYSLYLWHQPLWLPINAVVERSTGSAGSWVVTFAISLGLAYASYRWIEQPGLRFATRHRAPSIRRS